MAKNQLFATKSLEQVLTEEAGEHRLKRALGPWALTAMGVGAVIGAGIFVATGKAAHEVAGPALMVSYMVAGLLCVFAALCYAEFASMAPVAGSAYTYAYTTLGELFAWIIGWDLILEYAVGAATVANGWSGYFQSVMTKIGLVLPFIFTGGPFLYDNGKVLPNVDGIYDSAHVGQKLVVVKDNLDKLEKAGVKPGKDKEIVCWVKKDVKSEDKTGGILGRVGDQGIEAKIQDLKNAWFDLPAILVAVLITIILVKGISESAKFNALMVFIKVSVVIFVILVGAFYINPENYHPFAPYGWTGVGFMGIPIHGQKNAGGDPIGMLAGAAIIFFAYIGFDAVSTQAEEAKNPKKDVPFGIIVSLLICTVLYISVVAVLTGMVKYDLISKNAGVSDAFKQAGLPWAEFIIAAAGVAGITSVLLVMMLSAPRIFLAMARDGLFPKKFFSDVHPKFKTPWKSTILVGAFVAIAAGLLPIDALLNLTNIGTLFAFIIVCAAVLVMRKINPNAVRPFRCPFVPVVPLAGIVLGLLLMLSLPYENWWRLIAWLVIGLFIYFSYGRHHSNLGKAMRGQTGQT
jgi:APA family basic amino acid/polyamine antiporter